MIRFVIEKSIDENTGLECWIVVDTLTGTVIDRAFDPDDAADIAGYYQDLEDGVPEYDEEPDPGEFQEWMDFDPDC